MPTQTISCKKEWFVDDSKCLFLKEMHSEICEACERKGGTRYITACPFGVAEPTSLDYSQEKLFECILHDENLYRISGGGVTFSGGEPLLQAEELIPVLERLKGKGINIAFETTLVAPLGRLGKVKEFVDLYIVDVKLQPQMLLNNTAYIKSLIKSLGVLRDNNIIFRLVFVDEVWENREKVKDQLLKIGISDIELLLCYNLGKIKYKRLSRDYFDYISNENNAAFFCLFFLNTE